MKKTLALLLTLTVILALAACGADKSALPAAPGGETPAVRSAERVGNYKLIRISRDGETKDFEAMGIVEEMAKTSGLSFNADGTGVFLSGGKESPITWDDAQFTLDDGAIMRYSYEDGVITIYGAESELSYRHD
jgi:hypothetical protein